MATIKLSGPVDLEELHDICAGVSALISIGVDGGELVLLLTGDEAEGCAELLVGWLEVAGIAVMQPVG